MAYTLVMVFIETSVFTNLITGLLSDDNYSELQKALSLNPEQGDMIPGSGGLRKIRWKQESKGKRGGIRAIYYFRVKHDQIIFVYAYAKNKTENLTPKQLQILREIVEEWK
jgi:hypothetical protein